MAKPADTQCAALIDEDGERCPNQISYDEAADNWSVLCKEHREQDEAARESGELRLARAPKSTTVSEEPTEEANE